MILHRTCVSVSVTFPMEFSREITWSFAGKTGRSSDIGLRACFKASASTLEEVAALTSAIEDLSHTVTWAADRTWSDIAGIIILQAH